MRITLREIEAFAAVCENGSFKDAAQQLSITPPAITRRVQKLEEMLGVQLIERTTRAVTPTNTGLEFYRRTHGIMEDLGLAVMSFQEGTQSRLSVVNVACITSATQYFLPEVIEEFYRMYPRVRVRILDVSAAECLTAVQNGAAEFGVNFSGSGEPGIAFTPLAHDRFVLACSRTHTLAKRKSVRWRELASHRYIAPYKGSGNRLLVDSRLAEMGIQIPWFYEVRHVSTSLGLAERGLGVAVLPRSALPRQSTSTLAIVPLDEPAIFRGVGILRREGGRLSAAAQALFEMFIAYWGAGSAELE